MKKSEILEIGQLSKKFKYKYKSNVTLLHVILLYFYKLINKNSLQAVTRELREQSALLQTTRAELQRIKQPLSAMHSNSTSVFSTSTPPPSLTASTGSDKKQSNTSNYEMQSTQEKRRQIDDIVRKVFILNFTYLFKIFICKK